jgi:hypothetical protein
MAARIVVVDTGRRGQDRLGFIREVEGRKNKFVRREIGR